MKIVWTLVLTWGCAAAASVCAQPGLSAWTTDAGSSELTNGALRLVAAVGQGQPIAAVSADAGPTLYQGFLGGAVLFPNLDHDADGLCDEVDPDNDNDGLADLEELHGNLFPVTTITDVNKADSDGDGASDGAEAVMASNPLDSQSLLRLTQFQMEADGTVTLAWQAQGGVRYRVDWGASLTDLHFANFMPGQVTATGGTGPWLDTVATTSFAKPSQSNAFFRVSVAP
jgi:hypothetical protein